jgi:hypothetical protein
MPHGIPVQDIANLPIALVLSLVDALDPAHQLVDVVNSPVYFPRLLLLVLLLMVFLPHGLSNGLSV